MKFLLFIEFTWKIACYKMYVYKNVYRHPHSEILHAPWKGCAAI